MDNSNKWIIADRIHHMAKDGLEELGKEVDVLTDLSRAALIDIIGEYEGIVISSKTAINKELIDRAVRLKIVARVGSGMEHVDMDYCQSKGIICLNSPEGNCNAVAEHAVGMLLSLSNKISRSNNELINGIWEREANRGFELANCTVGIIGYGHTGSAFASKFSGWGTKLLAYDKYKSDFGTNLVQEVELEELIRLSDIISFHVPYNTETHHWINTSFINRCNSGVILINTSRGAIADTLSLLEGIKSGQLGGICLDVFEDEPVSTGKVHDSQLYRELLSLQPVIATPHIAGWSRESKVLLVKVLLSKIEEVLKNQGVRW